MPSTGPEFDSRIAQLRSCNFLSFDSTSQERGKNIHLLPHPDSLRVFFAIKAALWYLTGGEQCSLDRKHQHSQCWCIAAGATVCVFNVLVSSEDFSHCVNNDKWHQLEGAALILYALHSQFYGPWQSCMATSAGAVVASLQIRTETVALAIAESSKFARRMTDRLSRDGLFQVFTWVYVSSCCPYILDVPSSHSSVLNQLANYYVSSVAYVYQAKSDFLLG